MDEWLIKHQIVRRINLGLSWWLTFHVSFWAIDYANKALESSPTFDVGVIIGAVMTPTLGLSGYIIKKYAETKQPETMKDE